jgi:hypothetical protein
LCAFSASANGTRRHVQASSSCPRFLCDRDACLTTITIRAFTIERNDRNLAVIGYLGTTLLKHPALGPEADMLECDIVRRFLLRATWKTKAER